MRFFRYFSSTSWSILLFSCLIFINQLFVLFKTNMEIDQQVITAFLNGTASSILIGCLFLLILSFIPIKFAGTRKTYIAAIFSAGLLPIIDLVYFNATLSRFNWSVWHDLNFYALKASLLEISSIKPQLWSLLAIISLGYFSFWVIKNCETGMNEKIRTYSIRAILFMGLLMFFFPLVTYPINSNFTPIVMRTIGLNDHLKVLSTGCLKGFARLNTSAAYSSSSSYSESERHELEAYGLLRPITRTLDSPKGEFNRIILVVFESLALEYLHSQNPLIPEAATAFFDRLATNYPACNQYYTSASPTLNGLYAMLNSRLIFTKELAQRRADNSLPKLFANKFACESSFVRGVSKFYSSENVILKSIFGFNNLITYEELVQDFPAPPYNAWGFHDDAVFNATLDAIRKKGKEPFFFLTKLIDLHQPPYYCGIKNENLPESVAKHPSPIVKSLYWADYLLKDFISRLQAEKLLDDKTLVIITADHYPPLGYEHKDIVNKDAMFVLGRIPLIFVANNLSALNNLNPDKICCQLDLAPTICDLSGLNPSDQLLGQSLLNSSVPARRIGYYNDTLYLHGPNIMLQQDISEQNTNPPALKKWINNIKAP